MTWQGKGSLSYVVISSLNCYLCARGNMPIRSHASPTIRSPSTGCALAGKRFRLLHGECAFLLYDVTGLSDMHAEKGNSKVKMTDTRAWPDNFYLMSAALLCPFPSPATLLAFYSQEEAWNSTRLAVWLLLVCEFTANEHSNFSHLNVFEACTEVRMWVKQGGPRQNTAEWIWEAGQSKQKATAVRACLQFWASPRGLKETHPPWTSICSCAWSKHQVA